MANSSLLLICCFLVFFTVTSCSKKFKMESTCGRIGGQCLMKDECPTEIKPENLGLCPQQQSEGAECCNGISTKTTLCDDFGGWCAPDKDFCNEQLIAKSATDCPEHTRCCILVH